MNTPASTSSTPDATDTRRLRPVRVRAVRHISRSLRRITLGGGDLSTLTVSRPCEWAKIFLPTAPEAVQIGRAYTLRGHSPDRHEVDIDVVLHPGGPLADWASRAQPGDEVFLAGPRGGFNVASFSRWLVLVADLSALPAMASILETLPAHVAEVRCIAQIDTIEDLDLLPEPFRERCNWTFGAVDAALDLVRSLSVPVDDGEVWVAGEAGLVRAVRSHCLKERKMPKERVHGSGYWKVGSQDHRDAATN